MVNTMKLLLLLLALISIGYSQDPLADDNWRSYAESNSNSDTTKSDSLKFIYNGIGFGIGSNYNISFIGYMENWMIDITGKGELKKTDLNTYNFDYRLFNDPVKSDNIQTYMSLSINYIETITKDNQLFIGGGFSINSTYYKLYDPLKILASDGIYYVEKESNIKFIANVGYMMNSEQLGIFCKVTTNPAFIVGVTMNISKSITRKKDLKQSDSDNYDWMNIP